MSFGALFFFFILFMFLFCAFMLISQQIHFLLQKFDIWQEAGYCLPHLRTICQFIHFSSNCWSFSFSFHIFGLLIDLAVRLWSFEQFFFLSPAVLFLSFSTHGHCSFHSTFLLISKCILLLFQPQMKSVLTFHLSFWAFSFFISFLDFEMRSLMSSVTLSCLSDAFSICSLSSMQSRIYSPTLSPLSKIHLPFRRCLGRAWRNSQGQTHLFICGCFSWCMSGLNLYRGVPCAAVDPYKNVRIICRQSVL